MAQDEVTLKSQYLAKVTGDLEHNEQERDRITAEVASLQEQLLALEGDHALLVGMQQTLAAGQKTAGKTNGSKKAPATPAGSPKKTAGTAARKQRSASPSSATETDQSTGAPTTLRDLVLAHLSQVSEPASAAEVADGLGKTHPGRSIQVTVVRNTLEGLVAKGHAVRSKQKRAVFYSAPAQADNATTQDTSAAVK